MHKKSTLKESLKKSVKLSIFLLITLILGCSKAPVAVTQSPIISDLEQIALTEEDLSKLDLVSDDLAQLKELGLKTNGSDCLIEKTNDDGNSAQLQSGICSYLIPSLNNSEIVIQLQKFSNQNDLNGSYQYNSLHYFSADGLLSENDFGDQSRFRVNSENDYGGEFNQEGVYYYHLWFSKNEYLIHISSKGSKDAKGYVSRIGQKILSKFE